jgi:gamma-glutamyltranspeptidase/glutathione hydrolase
MRARKSVAGLFLAALAAATTLFAQSRTPFGTPTPENPMPSAAINAVPGSRAQGWLSQGRSEVIARHGIVATSDPLAAQAGLDILKAGGNAVDAAVATGAVLDVTSQNDTGIGGDLFALVWVAKEEKLYALNSGGWAPAEWTPEFFTSTLNVKAVPFSGVNSSTVPGAISGYDQLLKRFGTMTFKETFESAAQLADDGWGLAERRHSDLRSAVNGLRADPDSASVFLENGQAPALYSIIRNPDLARALRMIQKDGRDAF